MLLSDEREVRLESEGRPEPSREKHADEKTARGARHGPSTHQGTSVVDFSVETASPGTLGAGRIGGARNGYRGSELAARRASRGGDQSPRIDVRVGFMVCGRRYVTC